MDYKYICNAIGSPGSSLETSGVVSPGKVMYCMYLKTVDSLENVFTKLVCMFVKSICFKCFA